MDIKERYVQVLSEMFREEIESIDVLADELETLNEQQQDTFIRAIENCGDLFNCTYLKILDSNFIKVFSDNEILQTFIDLHYSYPKIPVDTLITMVSSTEMNGDYVRELVHAGLSDSTITRLVQYYVETGEDYYTMFKQYSIYHEMDIKNILNMLDNGYVCDDDFMKFTANFYYTYLEAVDELRSTGIADEFLLGYINYQNLYQDYIDICKALAIDLAEAFVQTFSYIKKHSDAADSGMDILLYLLNYNCDNSRLDNINTLEKNYGMDKRDITITLLHDSDVILSDYIVSCIVAHHLKEFLPKETVTQVLLALDNKTLHLDQFITLLSMLETNPKEILHYLALNLESDSLGAVLNNLLDTDSDTKKSYSKLLSNILLFIEMDIKRS